MNEFRSSRRLWAALAALAALALPSTTGGAAQAKDGVVQAADFVADQVDSVVEQVSYTYTVSESGHPYKWVPYEPKQPKRKAEPLRAEAAQFTALAPSQADKSAAPHPLDDPFGDRLRPALPNVQQFLADDTDKKLPLDSLLSPPAIGGDSARQPLSTLPPLDLGERGDLPSTQDIIAQGRAERKPTCKSPDEILHTIDELDHLTGIRDASINPDNRPSSCDLEGGDFIPRQWASTTFIWQASGLCHKPAYFEDVHLERYGHSWGPYVQPLMSGAHFFLNVPILPYKMGLYPPNECIYTLGYYRPGSCAPYMLDPLPLSVRAALAQGGAAVGMAYLLP
jgi:hypothetical protein